MKKLFIISLLALAPMLTKAETIWQITDTSICTTAWHYGGCPGAVLLVDIGVWPVAPGHSVLVTYTHDNWATVLEKDADWVANVGNPYGGTDETWDALLNIGYTSLGGSLLPVEYALSVTTAGTSAWDNNGGWNYYFPGGGNDAIDIWW